MKHRVAVLMGGDSAEYAVSIKSGGVVFKHLNREYFEPYLITVRGSDWTCDLDGELYRINKDDFSLETRMGKIHFDVAFIAIHGTPGENGLLQAYFDLLKIPYTTCGHFQSALTFNKAVTNALLRQYGVRVADSFTVSKGQDIEGEKIIQKLGLPCFVKPSEAGSSFGVSKVKTEAELLPAIEKALEHDQLAICEAFVNGTEVTCGVWNFNGELKALPITEIVSKNEFFDYAAKYQGDSEEITPARLSDELTELVSETAKKVYTLLRLDAVCRVDFIVENNLPYVIEVNTVPGLSEESIIPQQARAAGYSLSDLFGMWVKHALKKA